MTRRLAVAALLSVFALMKIAAAAPLPQAWRFWRYWRAVEIGGAAQPRLVGILLPPEAYARSANRLADLRVVDDLGNEVPYVLEARHGHTRVETRSVRQLERSFVPGQYTLIELDVGERAPFHNALRVETPVTDFIAWAEVAVSDDARDWRIVCDRAPLFRFRKQSLEGTQILHYSETNARYVRVRILDGNERFALGGVLVLYQVSEMAERSPVAASLAPAPSKGAQTSAWRVDLGAELPINEVRFETGEAEFSRAVTIEQSEDGGEWDWAGEGEIYRFRWGDALREWLRVGFPERWSRHWRVRVANGNNSSLAGALVTLFMTPRRIVFRQQPGRSYSLLYGQSEAKLPGYDLARTAAAKELQAAVPAAFGPEQVNANYTDPRPWTEQHPAVLWIAVVVVIILLGASALRTLRQPT
jgi:hypothetical protein